MALSAAARPTTRPRPPAARRQSSQQYTHSGPDGTTNRPPLAEVHPVNVPVVPVKEKRATCDQGSPLGSTLHVVSATSKQSEESEGVELAWLGNLKRDELERLYIEASQKIQEREQKLMIAANIGKALLEKNLTLRSGIMNSMASSTSFYNLNDVEDMINQYSSVAPFDGPAKDCWDEGADAQSQPLDSPDSDSTPMVSQDTRFVSGHDYFGRQRANSDVSVEPSPWVAQEAGLVISRPASPSASIASFASRGSQLSIRQCSVSSSPISTKHRGHRTRPSLLQLQIVENQRQLASLGDQNDVLHQQIFQLQSEAEDARRDGSQKLVKLSKEIRGLKAELEAATLRNTELETSSSASRPSSAARPAPHVFAVRPAASPLRFPTQVSSRATEIPLSPSPSFEPEIDTSAHLLSPSRSVDTPTGQRLLHGESALVAQLLAKIKELEETNAAMAKAEEELGSRMGRAMEEDERLRDAHSVFEHSIVDLYMSSTYDDTASESSHILTADDRSHPTVSEQILRQLKPESPSSSLGSPSRKRRAPGNRHVIQSCKTVRSAIRKTELAFGTTIAADAIPRSTTQSSLGSYSIDLSIDSSTTSSPQRKSLAHKVSCSSIGPGGRPRIRITPSMEDLGRRHKSQDTCDQSTADDCMLEPRLNTSQCGSLRPSDAFPSNSKRSGQIKRVKATGTDVPQGSPSVIDTIVSNETTISRHEHASLHSTQDRRTSAWQPSVSTYRRRWSFSSTTSLSTDPRIDAPESPVHLLWTTAAVASTPKSAQKNGRTLGSELGSIFGGDDRKHDFDDDLPQQRRSASQPTSVANALKIWHPTANVDTETYSTDRSTASHGRLVPASAEEHNDDLECILLQPRYGNIDDIELSGSPLRSRDAALLARVQAEKQGEWTSDLPIIETGGLRDQDEPRGTQFELIGAVNDHQAVTWADDDDYGLSISEREAIELGLLQATAATRAKHGRSYGTIAQGLGPRAMLSGSPGTATVLRNSSHGSTQERALISTYAYSPRKLQARSRRAWASRESGFRSFTPRRAAEGQREDYWPETCDSPARPGTHCCTEDWVKGVAGNAGALVLLSNVDPDASEGEFEILDCPAWKKQGGRGTDYFPTSIRARYHPRMLKERATVLTQTTFGWVEDWVQFALVVFLAFLVTMEQGPKGHTQRVQMSRTPRRSRT